jgi:hypothetical protein
MIRLALLASFLALACRNPAPNEVPPLAPAPEPTPGGPSPGIPGVPDPERGPTAPPPDASISGGPVSFAPEFRSSAQAPADAGSPPPRGDAGAPRGDAGAPPAGDAGAPAPIDAPSAPLPPVPDAPADANRR